MAQRFELHIDLGNDAMQTPLDISLALSGVAQKVSGGWGTGDIWDVNGNNVGHFNIEDVDD